MTIQDQHVTPAAKGSWLVFAIKAVVILGLIAGFWIYVAQRYTLGIDAQTVRCLPYRYFLIDRWQKPTTAELVRGESIAARLTGKQRPPNARWTTEMIMAKRAVAFVPGTVVSVRESGISFALNGETWTHGTALETARRLGHEPGYYERDYVLEPGQFFFMGDNPHTYDSRYYGPLDEAMIVGRVVWAW